MIERELIFQPKGEMCAGCFHSHRDCSDLPFKDMPKISKADIDRTVIVKCTHYRERELAMHYNRQAL